MGCVYRGHEERWLTLKDIVEIHLKKKSWRILTGYFWLRTTPNGPEVPGIMFDGLSRRIRHHGVREERVM